MAWAAREPRTESDLIALITSLQDAVDSSDKRELELLRRNFSAAPADALCVGLLGELRSLRAATRARAGTNTWADLEALGRCLERAVRRRLLPPLPPVNHDGQCCNMPAVDVDGRTSTVGRIDNNDGGGSSSGGSVDSIVSPPINERSPFAGLVPGLMLAPVSPSQNANGRDGPACRSLAATFHEWRRDDDAVGTRRRVASTFSSSAASRSASRVASPTQASPPMPTDAAVGVVEERDGAMLVQPAAEALTEVQVAPIEKLAAVPFGLTEAVTFSTQPPTPPPPLVFAQRLNPELAVGRLSDADVGLRAPLALPAANPVAGVRAAPLELPAVGVAGEAAGGEPLLRRVRRGSGSHRNVLLQPLPPSEAPPALERAPNDTASLATVAVVQVSLLEESDVPEAVTAEKTTSAVTLSETLVNAAALFTLASRGALLPVPDTMPLVAVAPVAVVPATTLDDGRHEKRLPSAQALRRRAAPSAAALRPLRRQRNPLPPRPPPLLQQQPLSASARAATVAAEGRHTQRLRRLRDEAARRAVAAAPPPATVRTSASLATPVDDPLAFARRLQRRCPPVAEASVAEGFVRARALPRRPAYTVVADGTAPAPSRAQQPDASTAVASASTETATGTVEVSASRLRPALPPPALVPARRVLTNAVLRPASAAASRCAFISGALRLADACAAAGAGQAGEAGGVVVTAAPAWSCDENVGAKSSLHASLAQLDAAVLACVARGAS